MAINKYAFPRFGLNLNASLAKLLAFNFCPFFEAYCANFNLKFAFLIDKGAENDKIHNNVYDANSYNRLLLLGQALSTMKIIPDCKTAYITLTNAAKKRFDFQKGDTEGIVNYALSLKGIIFAAIFIEDAEQNIVKMIKRYPEGFAHGLATLSLLLAGSLLIFTIYFAFKTFLKISEAIFKK